MKNSSQKAIRRSFLSGILVLTSILLTGCGNRAPGQTGAGPIGNLGAVPAGIGNAVRGGRLLANLTPPAARAAVPPPGGGRIPPAAPGPAAKTPPAANAVPVPDRNPARTPAGPAPAPEEAPAVAPDRDPLPGEV